MLNKLKPTLSPQDPKFASWWESADGLVIRAKAAEDEDKLEEALFLYEKAAKMGDADAQYKCGGMYYDEYGVMYCDNGTRSLDKALYWYEKAARQGNVDAQYKCGGMYNCGNGTAKNTARTLYQKKQGWKFPNQDDTARRIRCFLRAARIHGFPCALMFFYDAAADGKQLVMNLAIFQPSHLEYECGSRFVLVSGNLRRRNPGLLKKRELLAADFLFAGCPAL